MSDQGGLISYKSTSGEICFMRTADIDRIVWKDDHTQIYLRARINGIPQIVETIDKPSAIAERIRAVEAGKSADPAPANPEPPSNIKTADGHTIALHMGGRITGAWLELPECQATNTSEVPTLGVVSHGFKPGQNYIQYRDGHRSNLPRFALSVDSRGKAEVQVLLYGEGHESAEMARLRTIDLKTLIGLVEAHQRHAVPDPQ